MGIAGKALATLFGFAVTAAALYAVVPRRVTPATLEEQEALADRKRCQVLFVGPSYVQSMVMPEVFNEEARRIGLPVHACKFGRKGLRGYEMRHYIQRLLQYEWPRLKLLIVDLTLRPRLGFEAENRFKRRMLEWHTFAAVPWLASFYQRDPRPWRDKAPEIWSHTLHVGGNYLQLGRGAELLSELRLVDALAGRRGATLPDVFEGDEGEEEDEEEPLEVKKRRSRRPIPEQHPDYRRRLKRIKHKKGKLLERGKTQPSEFASELREVIRGHGYEAYFLYAPVWVSNKPLRGSVRGEDRLVLLDFNDPFKYPELYREKHRGRTHHLNPEGSVVYSKLIARELHARGLAPVGIAPALRGGAMSAP
jgi:hypothetical protein